VSDEIVRVHAAGAPDPLGPYPHALIAGGIVLCSGQGARDPATGEVAGLERDGEGRVTGHDIRVQTEACLANLRRVLDAAGSGFERLLEVNVYLRDMGDFAGMNEVYAQHFPDGGPVRTTIGVAGLPGENFIEIRAVALGPSSEEER
jgi:reactive intermediate/imine deaminase